MIVPARPVDAVLFDLGGVLAEFGGLKGMRELAGVGSDEELWGRWLTCRWVRAFERGGCSPEDFAAGMVEDWALPLGAGEFLDAFRGWLVAPYPGAASLVLAVKDRMPVGCLSNTNQLHWDDRVSSWGLAELFDYPLLSFRLGLVKPDREIFDLASRTVGVEPGRLLFLDDTVINVEGAKAAGMQALQVRGVAEARRALETAGVL